MAIAVLYSEEEGLSEFSRFGLEAIVPHQLLIIFHVEPYLQQHHPGQEG